MENERKYFCKQSLFILRVKLNFKSVKDIGIRRKLSNYSLSLISNSTNFVVCNCSIFELNGKKFKHGFVFFLFPVILLILISFCF